MKSINFKITDEEKDALDAAAASEGLSLTAFFKVRCLGAEAQVGVDVMQRIQTLEKTVTALVVKIQSSNPGSAAPQPPPTRTRTGEPDEPERSARTTKPLTVRPPATSGPVTSSMADLAASAALKPAAGVRYYCRVKGCDFSAPSPKAKCSTHSGELVTAEKKKQL